MIDILFINPPLAGKRRLREFSSIGSHNPPVNLLYLSAAAEKAGFKSQILDAEISKFSIGLTVQEILKINPKFVGITAMTLSIETAAVIAKKLKSSDKGIQIIIGGIHLTSLPEKTMNDYPHFDIGVIGEGDITIVELLDTLSKNTPLENVKGIIYRTGNKIKITDARCFIEDLDELPFPSFHLLQNFPNKYRPSIQKFRRMPSSILLTSRGCPYKCIFCDSKGLKNSYRSYSVKYIISLIKYLQANYKIKDINFHDDTFTLYRHKIIEFCNTILSEKIDLTWSCQTRADLVDFELLSLMKKSGCWSIAFGIESGSQKILDFIKKGTKIQTIKGAVDSASKAGLETIGFIVIAPPAETKETMEETINFIKELNLTYILPLYFTPFPNSDSYEKIEEFGTLEKDWDKFTTFDLVFIPKGLSKEVLLDYKQRIYREFYLRPKTVLKFIKKIIHGYSWRKLILECLIFIKISMKNIFSKQEKM
ncbi:MAG: radical SAM protein [bacterium]